MSENSAVYDLGEIHRGTRGRARRGSAAATVAQASALPGLAGSASLFVPGLGHLLVREWQASLFFVSTMGCTAALGWSLWSCLDALLPLLGLLEIAPWAVAIAFAVLFLALAALHVLGTLDAHGARLRTCLPRRAHPIVASLASMVVPGWGQLLAGKRGRAALFFSTLWLVAAGWLVALPFSRDVLAKLGLQLPLDPDLIEHLVPVALMVVTGIVWAVAVWDAAASRASRG